ncbi:MAG: alpha/beta fold hydrolase [Anaerolineae bacterium]|nr:alpha/beta fold hydrolase [Anaerolineae bacterium]
MWHGAWCWDDFFLPYLAQHGYAAHALSLRGHGESEGHERLRWHTVGGYVADVAEVASRLPRPPIVIGHSMGGRVVQRYLHAHEAPAAVLLASAPPRGLLPATVRFAVRHPGAFARVNLTLSMKPVVSTPELCREGLFSPDTPQEIVESCYARLQDESYRGYVGMLVPALLPRVPRGVPVLVLGASNDHLISRRDVESTARVYGTGAEFFDMGHDMMLEPGWRQVADRILAWLDDHNL